VKSELLIQVGDMALNGANTDKEIRGNFSVALALGQEI